LPILLAESVDIDVGDVICIANSPNAYNLELTKDNLKELSRSWAVCDVCDRCDVSVVLVELFVMSVTDVMWALC